MAARAILTAQVGEEVIAQAVDGSARSVSLVLEDARRHRPVDGDRMAYFRCGESSIYVNADLDWEVADYGS